MLRPTEVLTAKTTVVPHDMSVRATGEMPEFIGPYRILERLGEGGFGIVYRAEQVEPIRREVALKVVKPGMDSEEIIRRFEAERQALALMEHPNIASVLDAGAAENGRPYFVMELVRGQPVTTYCDQRKLSVRQRLELFIPVCQAVHHAHQKAVLHRDLKPSNILVMEVDGKAVPKVIDFGIAKALGSSGAEMAASLLRTMAGMVMGTPQYMSPEQAGAAPDIDTRSDIYTLGVILYELLTGEPPLSAESLRKAAFDEVLRLIREVEAVRPSSRVIPASVIAQAKSAARQTEPAKLNRTLRGDLDWITLKALEKERERRYGSAAALARDLERYLASEPVEAGAHSVMYRFRKLVRRNRLAFGSAALIAVVLVAATAVSVWQVKLAIEAKKDATENAAAERSAREESEAITRFLTGVFRRPDPSHDGYTVTVADTLHAAAASLDRDLGTQPARRATLQSALGRTYHALGLFREAIPLQESARDFLRATKGPEHTDTLWAISHVAGSYFDAGRVAEALKMEEEVLALRRKVFGEEHSDTVDSMTNLATSYLKTERHEDALRMREKVLALRRKANGEEHRDTLNAMSNLADSYHEAGRRKEALKLQEEAFALCRRVPELEPPDVFQVMTNLAVFYSNAGRRDEAVKIQEKMLAYSREVCGPEHSDTLVALNNLAVTFSAAGRWAEALRMREEVLTLRRKVLGPEHPDTITAMHNLAFSCNAAGRTGEAIKMQEEVLALSRKVLPPNHREILRAMSNLAMFYSGARRLNEAIKMQEEVLALRRTVLGPEHPDTLGAITNLANSCSRAGRSEEALKLREELLPLSRKVNGPEHSDTLAAITNLANSYSRTGRGGEALKLREELLRLHRKVNGPEHPDTLTAMHNLADSLNEPAAVLKLREEVLALRRKVLAPDHPDTLDAMHNLANSYDDAGRMEEALVLREETLALSRKVLGPAHPGTLSAMQNVAGSYVDAGRLEEAIGLQEQLLGRLRSVFGPGHRETVDGITNLAKLYRKAGRREEADKLRSELEALRSAAFPAVRATLVAASGEWKWLHPLDGKDPAESMPGFHAAFFLPDFDDSRWKTGQDSADPAGGFGYGLSFAGVDIGRPANEAHRHTAYFRHRFRTDREHASLELRCQRDDGIIVYLDGKEVLRDNMEPGAEGYLLHCAEPMRPENDGRFHRFPIPGSLSAGEHTLAISVHNTALPSSDLRLGGVTIVEVELAPDAVRK